MSVHRTEIAPMENNSNENPNSNPSTPNESTSGWKVVVGMFGFAMFLTLCLVVYWKVYESSFSPLQRAIVKEFKDSKSRVEGGAYKSHLDGPKTVRIVFQVPFDPNFEQAKRNTISNRLAELAMQHLFDPEQYSILEVRFYTKNNDGDVQIKMDKHMMKDFPLPVEDLKE